MPSKIIDIGGRMLSYAGRIIAFIPVYFFARAGSFGWSGNRWLDGIGMRDMPALGGGYLLANADNYITITGLLTSDTIIALSAAPNNAVGTIAQAGRIILAQGVSYGAFEIYRSGKFIGRYCLTEGIGTILINHLANKLPNGVLNGTLLGVWKRSNIFYSIENISGYSVATSYWYSNTNGTGMLSDGSVVPSDSINPIKCRAYSSSGVQHLTQYTNNVKYSLKSIPLSFYCNTDRRWQVATYAGTSLTHTMIFAGFIPASTVARQLFGTIDITTLDGARTLFLRGNTLYLYYKEISLVDTLKFPNNYVIITGGWSGTYFYLRQQYPLLGLFFEKKSAAGSSPKNITITSRPTAIACSGANNNNVFSGYISYVQELVNDEIIHHYIPDQHTTSLLDVATKEKYSPNGVTANLHQSIDLGWSHHSTGYAIHYNGTDYRISPLAIASTAFVTYAGYTVIETIQPNAPYIDSRLSMYRYAVSNGYEMFTRYPHAFNADGTAKTLTYAELLSLPSLNSNIEISESDGKITDIKFK